MPVISTKRISLITQGLILFGLLIIQCLPLIWSLVLPFQFWIKQLIFFFIYIATFYLNLWLLVPRFLFTGKTGLFFIAIALLIVVVIFSNQQFDNLLNLESIMARKFPMPSKDMRPLRILLGYFSIMIMILLLIGSSTVISVSQKVRADNVLRQDLEQEKITSELSFLKAQINPHFFFNILNSIYALTASNGSVAREAVYTLSHLMRYVLYDTKHHLTTLTKEIAFVEDYMKLMELRLTDKVQVIFDKPSQVLEVEVAPMLFLPFVENAYKHGISNTQPSYIFIGLEQTGNTITIEVRNSLFDRQPDNKEESNGIGLVNTRRRLDLLYPGKYSLKTEANILLKEYQVVLKLDTV
jgi:two-component system LytT family sensor kinase